MEPHAFVAEVYRRMSLRHQVERPKPISGAEFGIASKAHVADWAKDDMQPFFDSKYK